MEPKFVVDNSIVMTWCFQDEVDPYAEGVLDCLSKASAVVPALWPLEVTNVLLVAERNGRLFESDSVRFITLLKQLPIAVDRAWPERSMKELLSIGRSHNLSSYDAAYLELAVRRGLPIATLDQNLLAAARRIDLRIFES
jgi:predicted nucleic acid-binding protein